MAIRQIGDPVDLNAAVPQIGKIQPGHYMEALRQRFQPISETTDIANQLTQYHVMKQDALEQQQMTERARQNRDDAMRSLQAWSPPKLNLGQQVTQQGSQTAGGKYTGAYVNPVAGYGPSGHWGNYPVSGREHNALDFAVPLNTRVTSPVNGQVVVAGWDSGGFGNSLRIKDSSGIYWILGHLNELDVKVGQKINAGQLVGLSGSSGKSTGPHLHLEARRGLWDPGSSFDFSNYFGW